jgi:hypothetical protein
VSDTPALKTFLMHIPKTAGHAIGSTVGWAYPEQRRLLAIGEGYSERTVSKAQLLAMPYDAFRARVDFCYGHVLAKDLQRWSSDAVYRDFAVITVLREPLERALSAYAYLRDHKEDLPDLSAWLPYPGRVVSACEVLAQCRTVSEFLAARPFGADGWLTSQCAAVSGSDCFADACSALTDRFTGFPSIEHLEFFQTIYQTRIGGPSAPLPELNMSSTAELLAELSPEDIGNFYRDAADDVRLYIWAKRHWRGHLEARLDERLLV